MSLVESVIDKIEAKILESVQYKLEILTELNKETLILTIKSLWENNLISVNTIDMSPLAEEIMKRINEDTDNV
jgi:hypothetical protein